MIMLFIIFSIPAIIKCQCYLLSEMTGMCKACRYGYYNKDFSISDPNSEFSNLSCISSSKTRIIKEYYIDNSIRDCSQCNGTLENPYNNIVKTMLIFLNQTFKNYEATLTIWLIGKNHWIIQNDMGVLKYLNLFRRYKFSLIIKPFPCTKKKIEGCYDNTLLTKPKIYLKTHLIRFFISGDFLIENIMFDGSDLHIFDNNKFLICGFNDLNQSFDDKCSLLNRNASTSIEGYSLFNIEYFVEYYKNSFKPMLTITNCDFSFFNFGFMSVISSFIWPAAISIKDSFFSYNFFPGGIFSTKNYDIFYFPTLKNDLELSNLIIENSFSVNFEIHLTNCKIINFNYFKIKELVYDPNKMTLLYFSDFSYFIYIDYCNFEDNSFLSDDLINFASLIKFNSATYNYRKYSILYITNSIFKNNLFPRQIWFTPNYDYLNNNALEMGLENITFSGPMIYFARLECVQITAININYINITNLIILYELSYTMYNAYFKENNFKNIDCPLKNKFVSLNEKIPTIFSFDTGKYKELDYQFRSVTPEGEISFDSFLLSNSIFSNCNCSIYHSKEKELIYDAIIKNNSISNCYPNNNLPLFYFICENQVTIDSNIFYMIKSDILFNCPHARNIKFQYCDFNFINASILKTSLYVPLPFNKITFRILYCNLININSEDDLFLVEGMFQTSAYVGDIKSSNFINISKSKTSIKDNCVNIINFFVEKFEISNCKFLYLNHTRAIKMYSPLKAYEFSITSLKIYNNTIVVKENSPLIQILNFDSIYIYFNNFLGNYLQSGELAFIDIFTDISEIKILKCIFMNLLGLYAGPIMINCNNIENILIYKCDFKGITALTLSNIIFTFWLKSTKFDNLINSSFFYSIKTLFFSSCEFFDKSFNSDICFSSLNKLSVNNISFSLFGIIGSTFDYCIGNGGCLQLNENSQLYIRNTIFKNSMSLLGSTIVLKKLSMIFLVDVISKTSISKKWGGSFLLINSSLKAINCFFYDSSSNQGGLVYGRDSKLLLINFTMYSSFSKNDGGGFYLINGEINFENINSNLSVAGKMGGFIFMKSGKLKLEHIILNNSIAVAQGGSLYFEGLQEIYINDMLIRKSKVNSNGMIFISAINNNTFKIYNSICEWNLGNYSCFYLKDCKIELKDFIFRGNIGRISLIFGGSLSNLGTIYFENCIFLNQNSDNLFNFDGFKIHYFNCLIHDIKHIRLSLFKLISTQIFLNNIYFKFNSLCLQDEDFDIQNNNHIFEIIDSEVTLLTNVIVTGEGHMMAVFKIENLKELLIKNCSMLSMNRPDYETLIYSENSYMIYITNSIFYNMISSGSSLIYTINSNITIENNFFYNCITYNEISIIKLTDELGKKSNLNFYFSENYLIDNNCKIISLENINNTIIKGINMINENSNQYKNQFICFNEINNIIILNSNFVNSFLSSFQITSLKKVHLFIYLIEVTNSYSLEEGAVFNIDSNFNVTIIKSLFSNNTSLENGGFMVIRCVPANSYLLINESIFINNTSNDAGSLIYFYNSPTFFINGINIYKNNKCLMGTLFASISSTVKFDYENKIFEGNQITGLKSGEIISFQLLLYDDFDNFQFIDNNSYIILQDDANDLNQTSVQLYNNKVNIIKGKANYDSLQIIGIPGLVYNLFFHYKNLMTSNEFYFKVKIGLRLCIRGEEYLNGQCNYCKNKYYSLHHYTLLDSANTILCSICEENADCMGYDSLIPHKGFWRFDENSTIMIKCKIEKSCPEQIHMLSIGSEEKYYKNFKYEYKCNQGYEGNLCANCGEGYGRNSDLECVICSDSPLLYIRFCLFSFVLMIFMVIQAKLALSFKDNDSKKRCMMKIMVDHMSFISFIYRFNVEWDSSISSYFTVTDKFVTTSPQEIFNFNCFLTLLFHTKENTYYFNFIMVSFSPFFFGFMTLLLQYLIDIIYNIYKARRAKKLKLLKSKIIFAEDSTTLMNKSMFSLRKLKKNMFALFIILYYNFYPRLILNGFQLFKCLKLNNSKNNYLEENPDVQCWTGQHLTLMASIGIPNLVIWGILIPIIISFTAFKLKIMMTLTLKFDYWKDLLNYITIDYQTDKYYWETFLYLQKFLVVGVSISTSRLDPVSQGGLMIMLFLIFFLVYEYYCPSKFNIANDYRMYSYMTLISTASFAILISNSLIDHSVKLLYLSLLLIINLIFTLGWLIQYLKAQLSGGKVLLEKITGKKRKK